MKRIFIVVAVIAIAALTVYGIYHATQNTSKIAGFASKDTLFYQKN